VSSFVTLRHHNQCVYYDADDELMMMLTQLSERCLDGARRLQVGLVVGATSTDPAAIAGRRTLVDGRPADSRAAAVEQ